MWQQYFTVATVEEALNVLAQHGAGARVVAGATDLLIELERGVRPDVTALIDIARVPGLNRIERVGDSVRLGALVTHNQVIADPLLVAQALPLAQACWEVGAPQIRNRATIAGNLITGSPANDTIPPLWALDASVTLASSQGERTVRLRDFYTGLRRTLMRPDELMTAITFPLLGDEARGVFLKLGLRRAQAISVVNCAAVVGFAADSVTVTRATIALGSVAPTVFEASAAAESLIGRTLTPDAIRDAARLAARAPSPIDDVRAPAAYRVEMIAVLVARALTRIAAGQAAVAAGFPVDPPMLASASAAPAVLSIVHTDTTPIETVINGEPMRVFGGADKTLLRFLREDAGLVGTKEGCSEGECGACTVLLDGAAVMACMIPAPRAHGAQIATIEGLSQPIANDDPDEAPQRMLHPLQQAFIDQTAVQCGYCTPGLLMAGAALLAEYPQPTRSQIEMSISGNLCRCTGYYAIFQAFEHASAAITSGAVGDLTINQTREEG